MSTLFVDTINEKTSGNGIYIPGHVLQVVQSTKTNALSSSSTSSINIGLSLSITPVSTSSKVLLICSVFASTTNSCSLFLLRGSTVLINGSESGYTRNPTFAHMHSSGAAGENVAYNYLDSPSTTSATTYKVQANTDAGTFYINRRSDTFINPTSSLIAMEIGG